MDPDTSETGGLMTVRVLLETENVRLGVFTCPPGDEAWHTLNNVGANAHVVFPGTPVRIARGRRGPQVADNTWVMLYQPDQDYRRHLLDPAGDRCAFVELAPQLLEELGYRTHHVGWAFGQGRVTVAAPVWLRMQVLVTGLVTGPPPDPLATEARLLDVVADVVRGPAGAARMVTRPQDRLRVGRRVEDACALLSTGLDEALTLSGLAHKLQVSPFHLARQFREHTGRSVHEYREQARLRTAGAAFLADSRSRLGDVAAAAGFASHSHLTNRFSRAFGMPPSRLRSLTAQVTR
jgi:AraC-like DNA-binding protein